MRYSVQLPTDRVGSDQGFTSAAAIGELAGALEEAGFDACYVTEHPFPPDRWLRSGGHHALDPFVSLTAAAAATKRIRLHTHIVVLGYRNPYLLAKAVTSLDVVSEGRVIFGAAAGYLEAEFRALGADFEHRNDVADEALAAMLEVWQGESVHRAGRGFEASGHTMQPMPAQRPHPPIWIGGNSVRAMQRAVRFGQAWCPFPLPAAGAGRTRTAAIESLDDLAARIEKLRALEAEARAGTARRLEICFVPFGLRMDEADGIDFDRLRDQIEALEALGVDWVSLGLPGRTRRDARASIDALAEGLSV